MLLVQKLSTSSNFTASEQVLTDYILQHSSQIILYSIYDLSNATHVSPATITRVCKKLGFDKFTDLKIKLATELGTFSLKAERIEPNYPITKDTSSDDIKNQLLSLHYQALNDTDSFLQISIVHS